MSVRYSVIVPVFNEEAVIEESYKQIKNVMEQTGDSYELIFVNDGSRDRSESILSALCDEDTTVKMLSFSRNFGHQIAITAGMEAAMGQAMIVIDADLQDPPEVILRMVEKWKEGFDVVYGKRISRKGESLFKKVTAAVFYRFLHHMTTVDIPVDAGDFRLVDRRVCDVLCSMREKNRYVRGLVSWAGFNQTAVMFHRAERFAGETKYPLKKMLKFALDGITSFSLKPLKTAGFLGGVLTLISLSYLVYAAVASFTSLPKTSGVMVMLAVCLLVNGFVLIALGIMGEYVGRIYDEVKGRPLYVIREKKGFNDEEK